MSNTTPKQDADFYARYLALRSHRDMTWLINDLARSPHKEIRDVAARFSADHSKAS